MSQPPILVIQMAGDAHKRTVRLENPIYSIGRDPENDIYIDNRLISRNHAYLSKVDSSGAYRLVDTDLKRDKSSANGVTVNSIRTRERLLKHGDLIELSPAVSIKYLEEYEEPPGDEGSSKPLKPSSPPTLPGAEEVY